MSTRMDGQMDELAAKAGAMLAPGYRVVGWEWSEGIPGGEGVPSETRIALLARRLLGEVKLDSSLSTGGLTASRWVEDGEERVSLSLDIGTALSGGTSNAQD